MLFHCIFGSDSLWWWAHCSWTGSVSCSTGLYSHRETIVFHWRNLLTDSSLNWANSLGTSALLSPAQHRFDCLMNALENSSCCAKWKVNFQGFFISIFVRSPQLQRRVSVFSFKLYLLPSFFLTGVNIISAAVISASVRQTWSFYCLEICQLCSGTSVFHPSAAA